jgi:hypothetical protein
MASKKLKKEPPTPQELQDQIDELKRRRRCCGFVFIPLSVLGLFALFLAYGLWIRSTHTEQITGLQRVSQRVASAQSDIMQLILELHGSVTVLQRGNFSWVMADQFPVTSCVEPAFYTSQGEVPLESTYELQNVQLGMINFTVLVINPPPVPLVQSFASDNFRWIRICLIDFTPIIAPLSTLGADGPRIMEFTHANVARLSITPNCYSTTECEVIPIVAEQYVGTDAYSITATQEPPLSSTEFFVEWNYKIQAPGAFNIGDSFTIIEPLQLVLLSS